MKKKVLFVLNLLWLLVVLAIISAVVWKVGSFFELFEGFPKGLDAYAYLFRIKFVSVYFPHIFWNPLWNSGVPTFTWSHPPLLALLGMLIHRILGLSYEQSLNSLGFISMVLLGVGVYGIVSEATRTKLLGLLVVFLLFLLSGTWGWWADGGNYPRVLGMGFWAIFIFLLLKYLRRRNGNKEALWWWLATVLSLHFSLITHLLTGGLALVIGGLLILLLVEKGRMKEMVKVLVVGLLTASYWYLPLFFTGHQAGSFFGSGVNQGAIWFSALLNIDTHQPFYSWPEKFVYLLGWVVVLALLSLFLSLFFKRLRPDLWTAKIAFIFMLFFLGLVFYEIANLFPWYPDKLFIDGLPALSAFFLTTLFAVLVVGIGIGSAFNFIKRDWLKEILCLFLFVPIFLLWPNIEKALPLAKKFVSDTGDKAAYGRRTEDSTHQAAFRQLLLNREREANYRFGTDTADVSLWWNWEYPDYPQTKDYFAQGVTFPNWQFWMENAIWKEEENYEETNFLLDWYGVKNFLVAIPNAKTRKFLARENDYKQVACAKIAAENSCEFEFNKATPILAPANQPVILVIGDPQHYDTLFRSWAKTGLGSKSVIWVKGPKSLDSISAGDLKAFSGVFLYGYDDLPSRVGSKLRKFVESGGGLIIESNRDKEPAVNLPDPYPVSDVQKTLISGEWAFQKGQADVGKQIKWEDFSKANLNGNDWGVTLARESKNWAQPIASSGGKDILVAGIFGKGKVIWSGMNLPFHLLTYKNSEETKFLQEALFWTLGETEEAQNGNFMASFVSPSQFNLKVDFQARGVLFKESYLSGWTAKAGSQKIKIWRGGPDLMYLDLSSVKKFPVMVEIRYHTFWMEKIAFLISLLTFIGMIDYLTGRRIITKFQTIFVKSLASKEDY